MSSRLYAVIGDPIDHSLSPVMHNAAFRAAGMPCRYHAIRVTISRLPEEVRNLRSRRYAGFNVTIPHKECVIPLLDEVTPLARTVGAVNTVIGARDALVGDNTDVPGFLAALDTMNGPEQDGPAVVLGSGGAARAVVCALVQRGLAVTVVTRNPEKSFVLDAPGPGTFRLVAAATPQARDKLENASVLVNATPAGLPPLHAVLPFPDNVRLNPRTVVMDLVYGYETPLLQRAARAGCPHSDGLEMLVQQGARAFQMWTGVDPDIDVMRRACRAALGKARSCSVS
ncbi:MAG: shikimate dehydrogenase [Chloroflexota bacterium]